MVLSGTADGAASNGAGPSVQINKDDRPIYLFRITLHHPTFRIPELLSIAKLYDFEIEFVSTNLHRGVLLVRLDNDEQVDKILERSVLVMSASRLLGRGGTYDELHNSIRSKLDEWAPFRESTFKFELEGINHHLVDARRIDIFRSFAYLDLKGKVQLKNPEACFIVYEDYEVDMSDLTHLPERRLERDGKFEQVYVGRFLGVSRARPFIAAHSVKQRKYYGNTSMDAEMGFLMAGQTLSAPGKIVYDPFVGTGSLLYSCAKWGSAVFGSDIDGRQMRGKAKGKGVVPGIKRAAEQYGCLDQILDCMTFDVTTHPWRRGGWVDAIITDPPYGVRAGAKRAGKKDPRRPMAEAPHVMPNGELSHLQEKYLPPSRPYELVHLMLDLIHLSRWMLVTGGRLVFFLPTISADYEAIDIPVAEGMREVKVGEGSVQDFGRWGRRLITMEKTEEYNGPPPSFNEYEDEEERLKAEAKVPGHHDFNKRYATRNRIHTGTSSTPRTESPAPSADLGPESDGRKLEEGVEGLRI